MEEKRTTNKTGANQERLKVSQTKVNSGYMNTHVGSIVTVACI